DAEGLSRARVDEQVGPGHGGRDPGAVRRRLEADGIGDTELGSETLPGRVPLAGSRAAVETQGSVWARSVDPRERAQQRGDALRLGAAPDEQQLAGDPVRVTSQRKVVHGDRVRDDDEP